MLHTPQKKVNLISSPDKFLVFIKYGIDLFDGLIRKEIFSWRLVHLLQMIEDSL